jgi:sugar-specific transcriptional regulator TrmB
MDQASTTAELVGLGFSQYEARAYIALVGQQPMTGYGLSNLSQIPQPKVYETLRRLQEKRAVVQTGSDPAKYVAVPPDHLVAALSDEYQRRIADVRSGLAALGQPASRDELRVFESLTAWPAIIDRARTMMRAGVRHIYVSAHVDQLRGLIDDLREADTRGVRCDVLSFGRAVAGLDLPNGRVLQHSSTNGVIYRHHQARHLALVVDSDQALWALAPDGGPCDALVGADPLLVAVVKGYVRHDTYVQTIYADFSDELVAKYGPGLERLIVPATEAAVPSETTASRTIRPARTRKTA